MSDIVKLSDRQKPVSYTIDVTHHYSGKVEIFVRDVSDDSRSIDAVIAFIIKWASQHMKERDIHVAMLERIDQLMDAQKETPEAKELSALASACAAYEREAFPNVLSKDSVAEQEILQGQYDVYAAAREEYRKKIAEQAVEIERLRAALHAWNAACHIDPMMEGPRFRGVSPILAQKACLLTITALEDRT